MTQAALNESQFGPLRLAIGRLAYWRYRLFVHKRHAGAVLERVCGMRLLVLPGVLNPLWMRTGAFFASQLTSQMLAGALDVLDMGSGSGVCSVAAAKFAQHVVAVDINPEAVRCTRINALLNRAEDRIEVLHGDLFEPLGERRFDTVLFNPPFLQRAPRDAADRAWASTDVAERFAAGLGRHLKPGGKAFLLLSSFGGAAEVFLHELRRHGFAISQVAGREFVNERLAIFKLVPSQGLT
jgi:HemK-related putative methylase